MAIKVAGFYGKEVLIVDMSVSEARFFMRFVFLALALILFVTWIGAYVAFHVSVALIHVLLVLAMIVFLIHLFSDRRSA
jgi:hypothetical protein